VRFSFQRTVELPNHTILADDGEQDSYTTLGADGLRVSHSILVTPEELKQREIDGLHRELVGVNHNLAHIEDAPLPWLPRLTSEEIERERTSLVNTRAAILARLAELEPAQPAKRKRKLSIKR